MSILGNKPSKTLQTVRVYRVLMEPGKPSEIKAKVTGRNWKYFAIAAVVVVTIGTIVAWQFIWHPSHPKLKWLLKKKWHSLCLTNHLLQYFHLQIWVVIQGGLFQRWITEEIITALSKSHTYLWFQGSQPSPIKQTCKGQAGERRIGRAVCAGGECPQRR